MNKFLFYVCFLILFKCIITQINQTTIHLEKYSKHYLGNSNNNSKIKDKSFFEWILLNDEVVLIIIIVLCVIIIIIIRCVIKSLHLKRIRRDFQEALDLQDSRIESSRIESDDLLI